MFLFGLPAPYGLDPLLLLLAALGLDALLGKMPFRVIPNPVAIIGRATEALDRRLNRERRGQAVRAIRGALAVLLVTVAAVAVGWGVSWLAAQHPLGLVLELVFLTALVAQRGPFDQASAVAQGLRSSVEAGRWAVGRVAENDPRALDAHGVARTAVESLAVRFGEGVVAPVFWYILFGLPGMLVYRTVNTMSGLIGHGTERYRAFGMTAARLDDVLNLIPARLAALILALGSAAVPRGNPWHALLIMLRDGRKHPSLNNGWPQAAMAGGLGLALAGPGRYRGVSVDAPWIGAGTARATEADIRRALYVFAVSCLIQAGLIALLALARLAA